MEPLVTYPNLSIKTKILLVYSLTLLVYILSATMLYQRQLTIATRDQAELGAKQSVEVLLSGIDSEVESARYIANSLLLNSDILRWLRRPSGLSDAETTQRANRVLVQTYAIYPNIESIFIYDNDGVSINASNHLTYNYVGDMLEAPWYDRAIRLDGGAFMTVNADGTLFSSSGQNNISFIRRVLDVDSMRPTGFLILNFNERFITSITDGASQKYDVRFYLYDELGQDIIRGQSLPPECVSAIEGESAILSVGGEPTFLYRASFPKYGWTVISAAPHRTNWWNAFALRLYIILLAAAISMYVFVSLYTAELITKPICGLIRSMRGVREGRFELVASNKRGDEFGELEDDYNIMINALNDMIKWQSAMEQERRRYELLIITEQFKPHFLYNTLDSISYLIHSGANDKAYSAVTALSRYYNSSLQKGAAMVPLRYEIDMIQSYLSLQKLRYIDMIADEYDVSPEAADTPVLRNILQPLVENSIYHGIKPSGEQGRITIKASVSGETLLLSVADDGIGMTLEQLSRLDSSRLQDNDSSFGLRGMVQRLRLFYNQHNVCEVTSKLYVGTTVTLTLPRGGKEGEDYAERTAS